MSRSLQLGRKVSYSDNEIIKVEKINPKKLHPQEIALKLNTKKFKSNLNIIKKTFIWFMSSCPWILHSRRHSITSLPHDAASTRFEIIFDGKSGCCGGRWCIVGCIVWLSTRASTQEFQLCRFGGICSLDRIYEFFCSLPCRSKNFLFNE